MPILESLWVQARNGVGPNALSLFYLMVLRSHVQNKNKGSTDVCQAPEIIL